MKKKNNDLPKKPSISKNDFIDFLANATPEEVNRYILEKGKPRKLISPMYFFDRDDSKRKVD